ncbi:hypothetical protein [Paenibacillus popilliae]|uniref:Phage coat protein n=1 Tax=Paenibacillus popilliae ATCC 14706 TaxID=1212764 RepID=M9M3S1_PAEPP|nr:hypothetical protein [Paenibacillus popilliae]GAC41898.1 hypothetical protein PPOP_1255 [Paenibacillus popilliae ATCC 14706]
MAEYTQTKFDSKSFNPVAFGKYVERIPSTKRNELIKSRALRGNQQIKDVFSSQTGTAFATIPMTGRIGGKPVNYDGQTNIDAQKTTTFERGVVVIGRAQAWIEQDFSSDITGGVNFMDNVAQQVAEYWDGIDQDTLLSILKGLFSMSGTKNLEFVNGHTLDITGKLGEDKEGNPLANVGAATLNSAIQKACGDNKAKFTLAIMHSVVATNLENIRLLTYLKQTDANGIQRDLAIATWNGRIVLIDDAMPVETVPSQGAEGKPGYVPAYEKYTTYIFGDGAFDYENIGAKVAFEMSRDPKTNGGQDTLYSRHRKVFAPFGISYTKKSQASLSPTDGELANGSNWELVHNGGTTKEYIDHKAIPIARIISKG